MRKPLYILDPRRGRLWLLTRPKSAPTDPPTVTVSPHRQRLRRRVGRSVLLGNHILCYIHLVSREVLSRADRALHAGRPFPSFVAHARARLCACPMATAGSPCTVQPCAAAARFVLAELAPPPTSAYAAARGGTESMQAAASRTKHLLAAGAAKALSAAAVASRARRPMARAAIGATALGHRRRQRAVGAGTVMCA